MKRPPFRRIEDAMVPTLLGLSPVALKVFVWLLAHVQVKQRTETFGAFTVVIGYGELVTTSRDMAAALPISRNVLDEAFEELGPDGKRPLIGWAPAWEHKTAKRRFWLLEPDRWLPKRPSAEGAPEPGLCGSKNEPQTEESESGSCGSENEPQDRASVAHGVGHRQNSVAQKMSHKTTSVAHGVGHRAVPPHTIIARTEALAAEALATGTGTGTGTGQGAREELQKTELQELQEQQEQELHPLDAAALKCTRLDLGLFLQMAAKKLVELWPKLAEWPAEPLPLWDRATKPEQRTAERLIELAMPCLDAGAPLGLWPEDATAAARCDALMRWLREQLVPKVYRTPWLWDPKHPRKKKPWVASLERFVTGEPEDPADWLKRTLAGGWEDWSASERVRRRRNGTSAHVEATA